MPSTPLTSTTQIRITRSTGCTPYIPGHGTPTLIIFERERTPVGETIRSVMGIKGEPETPSNFSEGVVWRAILHQVNQSKSESEWVSSLDSPRSAYSSHPWSIGGGATDLKELIQNKTLVLRDIVESVGIMAFTLEDEVFVKPPEHFNRHHLTLEQSRHIAKGDNVRDWQICGVEQVIFPYDNTFHVVQAHPLTICGFLTVLFS
jgi:hypothetical protein